MTRREMLKQLANRLPDLLSTVGLKTRRFGQPITNRWLCEVKDEIVGSQAGNVAASIKAGQWIVVDYKTDRELAQSGEDRYRRQVALYASAIAQATGQPAQGVLMRV